MIIDCGSATSSMQASLYSHYFGNLKALTNTAEVAVAFNGATSTIHGTFNATVIFDAKAYSIQFNIVEGSQYEAIIGLDFLDRYSTSMEFQKGLLMLDSGETIQILKHECDIIIRQYSAALLIEKLHHCREHTCPVL